MKKFGNVVFVLLLFFWLAAPLQVLAQEPTEKETLTQTQVEKIETFIKRQKTVGKIPGMAVVIVMGDQTVYRQGFGFADLEKQEPVTAETLFELGSTSKAFTALGILQLEQEGYLELSDPVEKYLAWLKMKHRGGEVPVTIAQFLYQTSGIPFESIGTIPEAEGENALEKTVRSLVGMELLHEPGSKFSYATINYDVLGLLIKELSGESFEAAVKKKVLIPLGLTDTYLSRDEAEAKGMAKGYKLCFGKPAAYDAPIYRGNTPAGYFITNIKDLARWLKIQMGTIEISGVDKALIEKSHVSDPALPGSNYGAGWFIMKTQKLIAHGGENPNFSSFIAFGEEKVGVAVLANTRSNFTSGTGSGILSILRGAEPQPSSPAYDMSLRFDGVSAKIVWILFPFLLLALILLLISFVKIAAKKKRFHGGGVKGIAAFIVSTVLVVIWGYLVSIIPSFLGYNLPLSFGFVWMPMTFTYAILAIFLLGFLYYLFFLSAFFFRKPRS